jgi:hypothetical protein
VCWQEQTVSRRRTKVFLLQPELQMHSKKSRQGFLPIQISATTPGLGWQRFEMCVYVAIHCMNANSLQRTVWYIEDVAGKAPKRRQCANLCLLFGNVHIANCQFCLCPLVHVLAIYKVAILQAPRCHLVQLGAWQLKCPWMIWMCTRHLPAMKILFLLACGASHLRQFSVFSCFQAKATSGSSCYSGL